MTNDNDQAFNEIVDANREIERLKSELILEKSGRAQDKDELARCVRVLEGIGREPYWMNKTEMAQRAQQCLLAIGGWQRAEPGTPGSFIV